MPIDKRLTGEADVQIYELHQVSVAAVVHQGNFVHFSQGHKALLKWIETNGYQINDPFREIYIKHDPQDLSESIHEIQYPVVKI